MASAATDGRRKRFTVDALFADHRPQAIGVSDLPTAKEIRLDRIEPDPEQPRRTFDEVRLTELATSIGIEGVLQPIVVRYDEARDIYVIVHGERRWRASRQAGLTAIPALVRDVPEERRLIQQLMENIVREDLNPIDRAAALRVLKNQLGDAPWEQVAEAVGIRRSRLFQLLGTEKLPDEIQDDIRAGRLSEKQSRALQGLPEGHQLALRDAIIDGELSAEEAMRLARALRATDTPDDRESAAAAIGSIRASEAAQPADQPDVPSPDNEATALFAAIAAAATGKRAERTALVRVADSYRVPAYDADRLRSEILALARSLARTPAGELKTGAGTHSALVALYSALDVALGQGD
jgi:ParB/RepB/Spo0J family partition protein